MSSMTRTIERGNKFTPIYAPNTMRIRWRRKAAERQAQHAASRARSGYAEHDSALSRVREFGHSPMNPFAALAPLISSVRRFFTPKSTKGR